jgi:hypothetical protein
MLYAVEKEWRRANCHIQFRYPVVWKVLFKAILTIFELWQGKLLACPHMRHVCPFFDLHSIFGQVGEAYSASREPERHPLFCVIAATRHNTAGVCLMAG